jgi:hypothetical protein
MRDIAKGLLYPLDLEECEDGWLVAGVDSCNVEFVSTPDVGRLPRLKKRLGTPRALALIPGLGLAVLDTGRQCIEFFATPDALAMASMSEAREGWMVAVARGQLQARAERLRVRRISNHPDVAGTATASASNSESAGGLVSDDFKL